MTPYYIEELLRAMAREREDEARRARTSTLARESQRENSEPLRSRLARLLVEVARHLDPSIGKAGRPSAGRA